MPYVNFTEAAIAGDPFGEHGGTPGFPLPDDFLKLVKVACVYNDQRIGPVDLNTESARTDRVRGGVPTAFVSGNRLVPLRPLASGNSGDIWARSILSIQLSYVALPRLTSWDTPLVLPAALTEALIAGMVETLAFSTPTMSAGERTGFSTAARQAEEAISSFSLDVTGTAMRSSVLYRG